MSGYLAVGHGLEPSGIFDPGAVSYDMTREHDLAHKVVEAAALVLTSAGVQAFIERNSGNSEDPDYRGSTAMVNAQKATWAVEVHFDSGNAPPGGFGLFVSDAGHRMASDINDRWIKSGFPTRPSQSRPELYFLNSTNCPALIWECDPVGRHEDATLTRMGYALGQGLVDYVGQLVQPAPVPTPPPPPYIPPVTVPAWPGRYFVYPPLTGGNDVRTWQMKMRMRGWNIVADGSYGPQSKGACIAFQKEKHLVVDGVVGPATWAATWTAPVT